jgi:Cu2+-containing amine oxidase
MTVMGIGWKKQGGSAPFFTLTVHNGTSVTDVASTIAPTDNQSIDWVVYSDGTGNVTLYINGAQAATTTAGPTGITNNFGNAYREQVEAAATPAARQIMECTGGFLYIEG